MHIMLPVTFYHTSLNFLVLVIRFIRLQRLHRQNKFTDEEISEEVALLTGILLEMCRNFIVLTKLAFQFLKMKQRKRKLYKPHLLLQLLAGYRYFHTHFYIEWFNFNILASLDIFMTYVWHRSTLHQTDVWNNLAQNWMHFFWLSGETPNTLFTLVQEIEGRHLNYFHKGRPSKLSLKNQVSKC